ncbi:MAG: hypothetical protein MZV63_23690 [Marinilabiliales bacterium]|nr:hypothetical protein [Marinilabiliales bacterium]
MAQDGRSLPVAGRHDEDHRGQARRFRGDVRAFGRRHLLPFSGSAHLLCAVLAPVSYYTGIGFINNTEVGGRARSPVRVHERPCILGRCRRMHGKPRDHEADPPEGPIRTGRIGLIVAGSMITGFVVALVLVIGPFGGAQEHVVMGAALLGWALGWALLAALSTLWTDQPQRWAFVPGAVVAVAGGGLLIFRPDANAFNVLGWMWPPALIALAWVDDCSGPSQPAQPRAAVSAVSAVRRHRHCRRRRQLRDDSGTGRPQHHRDAGPPGGRRRAPPVSALHRIGQPHSRAGVRFG